MEKYEWLVFTCRACRRVIKLAPAMAGKHVVCPHCRTKVTVPKDAAIIEEAPAQSQIPAARTDDGMMSQLRGTGREAWEVGGRVTGGDVEFRERLHTTSAPEMQPDPDKAMRRVNMRRKKHESLHKDFDDPEESLRRKRHRKTKNKGAAFNQTFVRMLVFFVIVLAITAGWLGWKEWHKPKPQQVHKPTHVQNAPEEPAQSPGGTKLDMRSFAEYGPALVATVRKFVSAPTIEDLLPLVRDRQRVEAKVRAYYTTERPWKPLEINNRFEPSDQFTVDGDFIVLQLVLANFDEMPISLERKGDTFLVDWESFTGYGEMSWDEFQAKRPVLPVVMRVVVERSRNTDYWNEAFTDHTTHTCYLLRDLKNEHHLSGYALQTSPVDSKLRQYLTPLPPPASLQRTLAVLRLRYPPNSKGAHQVEIVEFLENGWVFRPEN